MNTLIILAQSHFCSEHLLPMRKIHHGYSLFALLFTISFTSMIHAQQQTISTQKDTKKTSITVYNGGFGIVREQRTLNILKGLNIIRYEDVAAQIDPTSISIKSLTDPAGITVREQNYQYDLLNPTSILNKSVGKPIRFRQFSSNGQLTIVEGTLLNPPISVVAGSDMNYSSYNGLVIRTTDGKILLNPIGEIIIDEVPKGLVSRPSLVWKLFGAKGGDMTTEVAYITQQLNWKADYVAVINDDDSKIDLTSWVTLDNKSGTSYNDAQLQLIAGDVRRVQDNANYNTYDMNKTMARAEMSSSAPEFKEESFFEYHLYTLDGLTTVADNETKQMQLMGVSNASVKKKLIFDQNFATRFSRGYSPGGGSGTDEIKAAIVVELKNEKANNMGMPLPKGKVRVYKSDSRGNMQFIGEDNIDHTPKDETIRLYLGDAFDVVGTRRLVDQKNISNRVQETSWEVTIRNRKDVATDVNVIEHVWGDWEVTKNTMKFSKIDARTIEFPLSMKAGESKTLTYTIRSKW